MPATGFARPNAAQAMDEPSELRTTTNVRKPSEIVLITLCAVQAATSTATSQIAATHRMTWHRSRLRVDVGRSVAAAARHGRARLKVPAALIVAPPAPSGGSTQD